jgi:hypothetical protein
VSLAMERSCAAIDVYFVGLTTMAAEVLIFAKSKQGYGKMVSMIVREDPEDGETLLHLLRSWFSAVNREIYKNIYFLH